MFTIDVALEDGMRSIALPPASFKPAAVVAVTIIVPVLGVSLVATEATY
jgi:hypothetical protein